MKPVPRNKTAIGCKWIFKVKVTPDNTPVRFKARLVAQGFSQNCEVDYEEVFAPVVTTTIIRAVLSLAGQRQYFVKHSDVKTAFLNRQLKETIYMKQPPGHVKQGQEEFGCRLHKRIYGLKQSVKSWYDTLNNTLTEYGFSRYPNNPCLYSHGNKTRSNLLVNGDNIIIACCPISRINDTIQVLNNKFNIFDLGDIKCYLGVEVMRNANREFFIS